MVYRTQKWWIFPWLTVNVITRWYVKCPPGPAHPLDLAAPKHDARVRMPDLMAMSDTLSDKMLVT